MATGQNSQLWSTSNSLETNTPTIVTKHEELSEKFPSQNFEQLLSLTTLCVEKVLQRTVTWLVSSYIDSLSLHKLFACHAFGSFGKILLSLCVCVLYIHWLSVWSLLCSQSESLCCVLWALVSVKTHWWFKKSCGSLYYNDWNKAAQLPVKFQELELRKVKWKDKKIEIIQEKVFQITLNTL